MFRATTSPNDDFQAWVGPDLQQFDSTTKSLLRRAFSAGWNAAVKSFLPGNANQQAAFALNQEISQLIKDFGPEPDRSVAIVGCAFLDEALETALASAFVDCEEAKDMARDKFQSYGARCNLAFCLGFYTRDSLTDLVSLGWIRNRFAHRRAVASFSTQEIQDRCLNLKTVKAIQGWTETNPRNCFIAAVSVISMALTHRARGEPQRASWGHLWEAC